MSFSEDRWSQALKIARTAFGELRAAGGGEQRFIAVFLVDSEPGFTMVTAQRAKDLGVSRDESARRLRETIAMGAVGGGELCMAAVLTPPMLSGMLSDLEVRDEAVLASVAAAMASLRAEPAGEGNVVLLADGAAEVRRISLEEKHEARFATGAATDEERDARLQTVLEEGASKEILAKLNDFLAKGVASRNAAVYVERQVDGARHVVVGYRTGIAEAVKARAGKAAPLGAVLAMLKRHPTPGNVFCVFVLWRQDGLTDIACVEIKAQATH